MPTPIDLFPERFVSYSRSPHPYADCYFESMSGFTTTGASVLKDFGGFPMGLHFWRCFTHWLGGIGIILLFIALLPFIGVGGRALLRREASAPVREALTPRVKQTAMILTQMYLAFTILQTLLLMLCGMSLFDALTHTFATLATGGFSTHPQSIAGYENFATELTIIAFMVLAGTNFTLYFRIIRGDRQALIKSPEWRAYIGIMAVASLFTAVFLRGSGLYQSVFAALRDATFQVVSLMTTTGFVTADFNTWPLSVKYLLVFLMFIGGCAGSTGGAIKVVRWIILARIGWGQFEKIYSPRTVRQLRLGSLIISGDVQLATLGFFFTWVMIFAIGTFLLTLLEGHRIDLVTATTAVAATLNNIGPGLGMVGAVENYAFFQWSTKYLLSLMMVLGRLELYTILVLFVPSFWRTR